MRSVRLTSPILLAFVLVPVPLPSSSAAAQSTVSSGDRVRVFVHPAAGPDAEAGVQEAGGEPVEGTLSEIRADTLCLLRAGTDPEPRTMALPLSSISRLEIYRGTSSKVWLGAGIGFAVGFVPMFAACTAGGCGDQEDYGACCIGYGAAAGLGVALLGALAGAAIRTERWEELPLQTVRLSVTPTQVAIRIGL